MTRTDARWFLAFALVAVSVAGCTKTEDSATVSGHVTLEGDLLGRGTVAFYPIGTGKIAYGHIQSDGNYTLRVGRGKDGKSGLPPGEYTVVIKSNLPAAVGIGERGGPPDPSASVIPARYVNPSTTPFSVTVKAGPNVYDMDLEWTAEDRAAAEEAAAKAAAAKQQVTAPDDVAKEPATTGTDTATIDTVSADDATADENVSDEKSAGDKPADAEEAADSTSDEDETAKPAEDTPPNDDPVEKPESTDPPDGDESAGGEQETDTDAEPNGAE